MTAEQLLAVTEAMNKYTIYEIDDGQWRVELDLGQGRMTRVFTGRRQEWLKNGQLHREDGAAIIYVDGRREWYLDGAPMSQEEHASRTKNIT